MIGLLAMAGGAAAGPFGLSGSWQHFKNGGDLEPMSSFNQSYSLNFSKDLSAALSFSGAARYNERRSSPGSDSSSLSPSAAIDLRNDLFAINLSGSETRSDSDTSSTLVNRSLNANGYLFAERWPQLRLNYGLSENRDSLTPRSQQSEATHLGAGLDYKWSLLECLYDFRTNSSDDLVSGSSSDSDTHFGRLRLTKALLDRRLSINAAQQYSRSDTETGSRVGPGGQFLVPATLLQAFAGRDDTPEDGALAETPALIDTDREGSAGVPIALSGAPQNLGIQVNFQPVDRLRIYLQRLLDNATTSLLSWDLYSSSDGLEWVRIPELPQVSYLEELGRTVVQLDVPGPSVEARYLKAVVRSSLTALEEVLVTELEAGQLRTATSDRATVSTSFESLQSQLSLALRPGAGWSLSYSLNRTEDRPELGLRSTQLSQSLSLGLVPGPATSWSFGATESRDDTEGSEAQRHRSYSAVFNTAPLPTLDLSLGVSRSDGYDGGTRTSTSDTANGFVTATIYRDLSASLGSSWSRSRDLDAGSSSTSSAWNFTTTARLSPRLSLDGHINYARSKSRAAAPTDPAEEQPAGNDSDSTAYGGSVNFRPSDILLLNGSASRDEDADSTSVSGNLVWKCTPRLQTAGSAALEYGGEETQSYNVSLNWSISDHFFFRSSYGYQHSEDAALWNLTSSLNATF